MTEPVVSCNTCVSILNILLYVKVTEILTNIAYLFGKCYVAISVFNQSRPGQRINSVRVIGTDAAYRNPRFRSIPSGKLPTMGIETEN